MLLSKKRVEQLTNIAIFLLKSHNPEAIYGLKDFLTIVPNSEKSKQIMISAIYQVIETDPETIYWLLKNPTYLQPEVDVREIVIQKLNEKFILLGFTKEDIYFNQHRDLEFTAVIKEKLIKAEYSGDERAIMTLIQYFLNVLI